MYNSDNAEYRRDLVDALRAIMLKIMVIPQQQQKSAEQLIEVYNKLYRIFTENCMVNSKDEEGAGPDAEVPE